MATKFELSCNKGKPGNTGFNGSCFPDIKQIEGAFIVPLDLLIPLASLTRTAILPYLATLAKADNAFARVYPIHNFIGAEVSGGDRRTFTSGYGSNLTTGENDYLWRFQYTSGGMQLQTQLRRFNSNGQWAIIFYDSKNLYLMYNDDEDKTDSGFPTTTLWSEALQPNNGTDPTLYYLAVGMKTIYLNDQVHALQYSGNPASVKGLQDVTLEDLDWDEATGVVNVKLTIGETDLYDLHADQLDDPTVWKAYNAETGGEITVTSAVKNAGSKAITLTLDTADGDYPAADEGITVDLVGPTELDAKDITGYESSGVIELATF